MQTHKSYHSYLVESLTDPSEAAAYLDAVFEDGDREHILVALRNVAEACSLVQSGQAVDSENDWTKILDAVANGDASELSMISELLSTLGLRLSVSMREEQAAGAA